MAKKLTLDDINKAIKKADYYVFPGTTMTVCCLTLLHDYTVIGKSACIDPDAFDEALGRTYAQQDAVQQIWELEAYLTMYKNAKGEDPVFSVSAINDPVIILTPEAPVPPPEEPPAPPPPPVETAEPGALIPDTPSGIETPIPQPEVPPSDPLPEDPPSPVEPPSSPPEEPESPPAPPADPAPEPAPEPTPDAPAMAMTVNKPISELTPEELVVEEAALIEREQAEIDREAAETQREADWAAAHPGNPAPGSPPPAELGMQGHAPNFTQTQN